MTITKALSSKEALVGTKLPGVQCEQATHLPIQCESPGILGLDGQACMSYIFKVIILQTVSVGELVYFC